MTGRSSWLFRLLFVLILLFERSLALPITARMMNGSTTIIVTLHKYWSEATSTCSVSCLLLSTEELNRRQRTSD
uniref:Secreted protein n=1 Tax=Anguilla anguilla TaxID=7936 RepID=A0A0E9SU54_ANGAN